MNKKLRKKIILYAFLFLLGVSIFFRLFNYNWGAPFYFHPDERNVASAVTQLEFPEKLNPVFFAYGSLPIYTIYSIGLFQNLAIQEDQITKVNFEQAIVISRLISAILSTLIIFMVYFFVRERLNRYFAITASLLTAFNVGLIQYSHFGTFEIWLTFLFLLLFLSLIKYLKTESIHYLFLSGIILGLLVSVKVSSVIIAPLVAGIVVWRIYKSYFHKSKKLLITKIFFSFVSIFIISTLTLILVFPYIILDTQSFLSSMDYESAVALGTLKVFYTGGFIDTIPIVYQLIFVYPYLLNPLNLLLVVFLLPLVIYYAFKKKAGWIFLCLSFFLFIFLSQAFLYVKWTRYYVPTIPFLIILLTFGLKIFFDKLKRKNLEYLSLGIILFVSLIFSFAYFKTVLLDSDTRLEAAEFAKEHIPPDSKIISEIYDLGIVPFNENFQDIILFDFYALDDEWTKDIKSEELEELLRDSEYLILPSQRILRNRTIYKDNFPEGHKFYSNIENNFDLIYMTSCDIYCKILYLGNPIYSVEETANVFDRPTIMIYRIN